MVRFKLPLGCFVHDAFGFGFLNASEMVINAQNWTRVSKQNMCKILDLDFPTFKRRKMHKYIQFKHFSSDMCVNTSREITRLENVQLKLDLWAHDPNNLQIFLTSPMTTVSRLMTKRSKKPHSSSSINWTYMSVHFWDENPSGEWTLKIKVPREKKEYEIRLKEPIKIKHVAVILYGTASSKNDTGAHTKMTQDTPSNKNDTDMKDSPMQLVILLIPIGLFLLLSVSLVFILVCLALRKYINRLFGPADETSFKNKCKPVRQ